MSKLFISYARADKGQVDQLVELFREAEHDPWFDHRLLPGEAFKQALKAAIVDCDIFIYVLSLQSVKSEWCQWEFAEAIEQSKPILPILIQEDIELPSLLKDLHHLDLTQGITPQRTAKLIAGLSRAIKVPKAKKPDAPQNPTGIPAQMSQGDQIIQDGMDQPADIEEEPDDEEDVEELADEIVRALLQIQDDGDILHFGSFKVKVDRDDPWSVYEFFAFVDPTPYASDERLYKPNKLKKLTEDESMAEWSKQRASQENTKKEIRKQLIEMGWSRAGLSKRWPLTKSERALRAIAYELIETQNEIFGFYPPAGDVKTWPRE